MNDYDLALEAVAEGWAILQMLAETDNDERWFASTFASNLDGIAAKLGWPNALAICRYQAEEENKYRDRYYYMYY